MRTTNRFLEFFPYLLVLLGASARLLPHAPNFAPIAALALFGAVYLRKRDGLWVPLAAMLVSDLVIGFYNPLVMASVYGSFVLIGLVGIWLRRYQPVIPGTDQESRQKNKHKNVFGFLFLDSRVRGNDVRRGCWWPRVFGASLLGSILFFLITNWAVWAWGELYTKDLSGLMMSYLMGLPFFRNTLLGDLFYVSVFFGIAALAAAYVRQHKGALRFAPALKIKT